MRELRLSASKVAAAELIKTYAPAKAVANGAGVALHFDFFDGIVIAPLLAAPRVYYGINADALMPRQGAAELQW
jgi:hypothetical protein